MLKKFSKFLLLTLLILVISCSSFICLAHETEESTDTVTATETNEESTSTEQEIHTGDLYLFDNDIVMDQLVDGNVFIFGNNVEITGKVNGNLFVFANNINFNQCTIMYSIYACGNSVYYNGGCYYGDLYVASNKLELTYNSFVRRDVKAIASDIICKVAVGRDAELLCNTVDFGESEDIPMINGNLRYTANKEATVPEGAVVSGNITYTKPSELNYTNSSILDILIGFVACVVTVLALYIILNRITPSFIEKVSNQKFKIIKLLRDLGVGLATVIIASILFVILLLTAVGSKLAIILALLFAILCFIAVPALAVSITNALKPALKIEKTSIFYLILSLVNIILYGITFIPYIGGLLGFIITVTAIGLIINIYLPHREFTAEEKVAIEEAKKQAKEDKEKKKQAKLEEKTVKKEEKLKIKQTKKQEKAETKQDKKQKKTETKETKKKDK